MVMTSYYEFSNDQDIIAVQFNNGLRAEFSDQYCTKVGRNDPCLCGSGKKYKKCCGIMVG